MKSNPSRPGFELVSPCPFPTTITITPRAPPPTVCPLTSHLKIHPSKTNKTCGTLLEKQGQTRVTFIYGSPRIDVPVLVDQQGLIYITSVRTLDVVVVLPIFLFSRFYYYCSSWVFHTSISWWSFSGVWVTESLFKSLELFSVYWPISTMLQSGWSISSSPLTKPFEIILSQPITICIIVTSHVPQRFLILW